MNYKQLIEEVLTKGKTKENRTGIKALTIPAFHLYHDMSEGFPLSTLRRHPYKSMTVELEGFINGVTNKQWYKYNKCNFWNYWANPQIVKKRMDEEYPPKGEVPDKEEAEEYLKSIQESTVDLGPIYGSQWRDFDAEYTDGVDQDRYYFQLLRDARIKTCDQFQEIIDTLKSNPDDRRMLCSAWNPKQKHQQALPPCHVLFKLTHINGELNLEWYQRSTDIILGTPSNLPSYALLLLLFCKETNMKPGIVSGFLSECHIYEDHIEGAKELIKRDELKLPTVEITNFKDIYKWTHKDFLLHNYNHHPEMKFKVAI